VPGELVRGGPRAGQEHAPGGLSGGAERLDHVLLDLLAEPRQLAQLPLTGGRLELRTGLDAQHLEQRLYALGAEPLQLGESRHLERDLLGHRVEQLGAAGAGDVADLPGEVLADPLEALEPALLFAHRGHGLARALDDARGLAVRPHAERVRAVDLEHGREVRQRPRDLGVGTAVHVRPPRCA
jgi:hypothetical protein